MILGSSEFFKNLKKFQISSDDWSFFFFLVLTGPTYCAGRIIMSSPYDALVN
jgi:hypothetical protein